MKESGAVRKAAMQAHCNPVPTSGKAAESQRPRRVRYSRTTHLIGKTTTTSRDRLQMDTMFLGHHNTVSRPNSLVKDNKGIMVRAK